MTQPLPNFLVNIASVAGLLGISLYYTGWIYRWAYFAYYQLSITTLDLPVESFLLVPLQVLFGSSHAIVNTVIAGLLLIGLIPVTQIAIAFLLWHYTRLKTNLQNRRQNTNNPLPIFKSTLSLPLLREAIIIFWVLFILFHLAQAQGAADARRNAIDKTSTLPAISLIGGKEQLLLGKSLNSFQKDQPLADPPLQGNNLIGDTGLVQKIQTEGLNEIGEGKVWRLLIERGGWLYLIRTLPPNSSQEDRPPVLAIPKASDKQLLILSPNPASEANP